jgi:hypothetical protein
MAKRNQPFGLRSGLVVLSAAVVLVFVLGQPAQPAAETRIHRLAFSASDVGYRSHNGYDLVSLEGGRWLNRPGEPKLPLFPVRIALPAGCAIVGFAATGEDSVILAGDFTIWPSQPPQNMSPDRPVLFVDPQALVYDSNDLYPENLAELVGCGRLRGAVVCDILVYPLRYQPAEHRVILYTDVSLEVTYRWQVPVSGREILGRDLDLVESLTGGSGTLWEVEDHMMHDASVTPLGGDAVSYLIITTEGLRPYFQPLKRWKTRKGVPAEIVCIEAITFAYPGSDIQEKIRNCIKDFHTTCGTDWVLLGGDTQIVPDREARVNLSDRPYLPCDLYYSDLDGTWNDDSDMYWGEVPSDNIDMYADVYVGRAPVSNSVETETFVAKVLTYEGCFGETQDHALDMVFIGEVLWGDPGDPGSEDYTDAGVAKNMIDSEYVPARFSIDKLYESSGNLNYGAVMSLLNQGRNLINILCHGQYTWISIAEDDLRNSDFAALVNAPRYGLMYSTSCMSGGFDQNDCIGEIWTLTAQGGGFFIGNSRYGFNCPGFPGEGPSDYFDQSFFEAMFVTGFTNFGKAHADAKHEFVAEARSDAYMRYIMYGLNLLGDPETRLWTDVPAEMDVAHGATIEPGPQTFSITATSGGTPVEGATVCLYKPDDVYCVDVTNASGTAAIFIEPACVGTLFVTVTKPDLLPFVGEALVGDYSAPEVPQQVTAEEEIGPYVTVRWAPVGASDLHWYKVYRNMSPLPESLAVVPASDTAYADTAVTIGNTYFYWVSSVDSSGNESVVSQVCSLTVEGAISVPADPVDPSGQDSGLVVRPNPFSGSVCFVVPGKPVADARIDIFDAGGRWVGECYPQQIGDDQWTGRWDGTDSAGRRLPPGIYFVRFSPGIQVPTQKVVLLK